MRIKVVCLLKYQLMKPKLWEFKTEWDQEVDISKIGTIFHSYLALDIMQDHSLTVKSCMGLRGNSARMLAVHSDLVFTLLGLRLFSTACSDYGYCKLNVSDKISVGDICHFFYCTLERSRCESNNWSRFKKGSRRIQNQLKNYKLRQRLSLSHCPLITETAIVILCVQTGL